MNQVESHYDDNAEAEWGRLDRHRTEFAVTCRVLLEHSPPPPARVIDIGGGPGRYAIELSKLGYDVDLVDISSSCLSLAQEKAREIGVSINSVSQATAIDLAEFRSNFYDVAILFGPLYHLLTEAERNKAVSEAMRVLKPGGVIFAAFISRFAPFRHCARFDPGWVVKQPEYALSIFEGGVHDKESGFLNAYFAHPGEIEPLMEAHGAVTNLVVGCEGAVSMHEDEVNELTGEDWNIWVDLNYRIGTDPSALGASEHLLYVGTK